MQKRRDVPDNGSWSYAEELLERGDAAFVDELRRITDAERLGNFALKWFADRRPASRRLLLLYLQRPLNAFRHEALVKRLFKLAEQAGDDEIMAHFLAVFDRSLRRVKGKRHHYKHAAFSSRDEAAAEMQRWTEQGINVTNSYEWSGRHQLYGSWTEDVIFTPGGTTMWRPTDKDAKGPFPVDEHWRDGWQKRCWLFSLATRRYLRRRAWRYFRNLAKNTPERYVSAAVVALRLYQDEDVADGLALIDNWGLMHILFHHSPVLMSTQNGWTLAEGQSLKELQPAPFREDLWKAAPKQLLALLKDAQCRPVRQWAVRMIRRDHAALLENLPAEELFALLASDDVELMELAAEILGRLPNLAQLGIERLLGLVENANPQSLEFLCKLVQALKPEEVGLTRAARLAALRPIPTARLGFRWLRALKPASEEDCRTLLRLLEAECEPLRPAIVRWLRETLSASPHFQTLWVLDYLDSRHADVRKAGWQWLTEDPKTRDDTAIWQRLFETPYDDIKLPLIAALDQRVKQPPPDNGRLDGELVRFLWASVLLNIHRGGRTKPQVVEQLLRRLKKHPNEVGELLPILATALRSIRGPEWRIGLAGVVKLVEQHPNLAPLVQEKFPELLIPTNA